MSSGFIRQRGCPVGRYLSLAMQRALWHSVHTVDPVHGERHVSITVEIAIVPYPRVLISAEWHPVNQAQWEIWLSSSPIDREIPLSELTSRALELPNLVDEVAADWCDAMACLSWEEAATEDDLGPRIRDADDTDVQAAVAAIEAAYANPQ